MLEEGQEFVLTTRQMEGNSHICYQTYQDLPRDLKPETGFSLMTA